MDEDACGTYITKSQIKFKTSTSVLKSVLYDYSAAYILVSGTITITGEGINDYAKWADKREKGVIFKNFAPIDCISETNDTQIDEAKDIDIVMPMYNLVEYSDNYSKISAKW